MEKGGGANELMGHKVTDGETDNWLINQFCIPFNFRHSFDGTDPAFLTVSVHSPAKIRWESVPSELGKAFRWSAEADNRE